MAKKMLIDATQHEETRVAVLDNNGRLEEFDLEIQSRQQIKGNIYLAKVTRVEPSLQAAFVNFGGNRHGFLPFSEIHPDYYRIPVSDREALQAEIESMLSKRQSPEESEEMDSEEEMEADIAEALDELNEGDSEQPSEAESHTQAETEIIAEEKEEQPAAKKPRGRKRATKEVTEQVADTNEDAAAEKQNAEQTDASEGEQQPSENGEGQGDKRRGGRRGYRYRRGGGGGGGSRGQQRGRGGRGRYRDAPRGNSGEDDPDEEQDIQSYLFRRLHRSYKIQEVIKRGQIMLVQATKEERGNKGAAMTTYLSLPGRYSVLMPNSPRSGGVSRKVHDRGERDRLRDIFAGLNVPDGMSVILRTAGVSQKAEEIGRDYTYLQTNWSSVREKTLASTAPALIYQEGSVVKRAIRDIFREDISDIFIAGKEAYEEAKEFMEMLVPTQVKKIKEHKAEDPLFVHHRAEEQIAAIDNHTITLKSGGYLVFAPTEALVSIDINSGRSTRERHIEETALNTNLEAAEEIARQLRLRDIGGLIVIDFIDMEDHRHNILVERKFESALSKDRARIQIGRISQFGLLELSRQRLRPSLTESHFMTCPTCQGQGMIRTTESMAVVILRAIAQEGSKAKGGVIRLAVSQEVCMYLLNQKRESISSLEERYDLDVALSIDPSLGAASFTLNREKGEPVQHRSIEVDADSEEIAEESIETSDDNSGEPIPQIDNSESRPARRRGRRGGRNRRGGRDRDGRPEQFSSDEGGATDDPRGERPQRGQHRNMSPVATASPEKELQPTDHAPEDHEPEPAESADKPKKTRGRKAEATAETPDIPQEELVPSKAAVPPARTVKEYEVVNQAPETPKKGWWRKTGG